MDTLQCLCCVVFWLWCSHGKVWTNCTALIETNLLKFLLATSSVINQFLFFWYCDVCEYLEKIKIFMISFSIVTPYTLMSGYKTFRGIFCRHFVGRRASQVNSNFSAWLSPLPWMWSHCISPKLLYNKFVPDYTVSRSRIFIILFLLFCLYVVTLGYFLFRCSVL